MTHWKLLIAVPVLAAIAMVPQGESVATPPTEISHVVSISELQYRTPDGKTTTVSAKNVVEIRLIDDITDNIRLELYYENRDYSLVEVVGFDLLRSGGVTREIRLVRGQQTSMRFPNRLN